MSRKMRTWRGAAQCADGCALDERGVPSKRKYERRRGGVGLAIGLSGLGNGQILY